MQSSAVPSASWARRFGALFVDWAAATLVTVAFVGAHDYFAEGSGQLYPLLVYVVESALFTWLLGGSFGKLCLGLRVMPSDGVPRLINPLVLLVRQFLIALVIPPLIFRPDGRGLHDLMTGTVTVMKATYEASVDQAMGRRTA